MLKSKKKSFVSELEEIYKNSNSVIVVHYHGLTVADVTKLRTNLREKQAYLKVVKNTLAKIASSNIGANFDDSVFAGPTAIAYSEDPVAAAKEVVEFAKANDNLKIVGGLVNDQMLDVKAVEQLSKLPSLDELRGKIVGILQTPATNIARVLQAPASGLARVIKAHAEKN